MLKSDLMFDPNITKTTLSKGMLKPKSGWKYSHDLGGELPCYRSQKRWLCPVGC